jgi:AraC family transcriptional regulator
MTSPIHFNYRARITRVLHHLATHPGENAALPDLASIAGLSPFHFHRIFRAIAGETTAALVRRLRLERAARALRTTPAPVTDIALDAKYGSPEAFARAFQLAYRITPTAYRYIMPPPPYAPRLAEPLRLDPANLTLTLEPNDGGTRMDIRVETRPEQPAVCLRNIGPYTALGPAFQRVFQWAIPNRRLVPGYRIIGLSHDDPDSVPHAELRFDVCITVTDPPASLPEGFRNERIGGGRWAMHRLKGSYSQMPETFRRMLRRWLPSSGEQLDDRPFMEIYLNDVTEVPEAELLTEICIPLRMNFEP